MIDVQVIRNKIVGVLYDLNQKWCPIPEFRVVVIVDTHFVERLVERFPTGVAMKEFLAEIWEWMDQNYCMLIYENRVDPSEVSSHEIELKSGHTFVYIQFQGQMRLRTCY